MRFTAASEHFKFFEQRRFIEFDGLLTTHEIETLRQNGEEVLAARQKTSPQIAPYFLGRDVWRESPSIKKVLLKTSLGKLAAEFLKIKPLRLAFDQFLISGKGAQSPFDRPKTLRQMSCLKPITGGLAIRLDPNGPLPAAEDFCPCPSQAGNIILLHPDIQLSFDEFYKTPGHALLLIAYCGERTVYTYDETDPFTHQLKKLGYVFGDLLNNKTHPVVYR